MLILIVLRHIIDNNKSKLTEMVNKWTLEFGADEAPEKYLVPYHTENTRAACYVLGLIMVGDLVSDVFNGAVSLATGGISDPRTRCLLTLLIPFDIGILIAYVVLYLVISKKGLYFRGFQALVCVFFLVLEVEVTQLLRNNLEDLDDLYRPFINLIATCSVSSFYSSIMPWAKITT